MLHQQEITLNCDDLLPQSRQLTPMGYTWIVQVGSKPVRIMGKRLPAIIRMHPDCFHVKTLYTVD